MQPDNVRKCKCGRYVTDVYLDNGEFYFTTEHFESEKSAHEWVTNWAHWANNLFSGSVESIYYILQVPDTWAGPAPMAHPYNGLFIKIGRTNNVLKRLSNLQFSRTYSIVWPFNGATFTRPPLTQLSFTKSPALN